MESSNRCMKTIHNTLLLTIAAAIGATSLRAQCTPVWTGGGIPGTDGVVHAFGWWDPDGPGTAPVRRVIGGEFSVVGNTAAANIAMQDPASGAWLPLGAGVDGPVYALTTGSNDDLWVGGRFGAAGGSALPAGGVARWNGSWQSFYGGVAGTPGGGVSEVRALALDGTGNLLVGGNFATVGGTSSPIVNASFIARMNLGTLLWSTLGAGVTGDVLALTVQPGRIAAGGLFGIRFFDGTNWSTPGSGLGGVVHSLAVLQNGDLVAGGQFNLGSSSWIARWDGTSWNGFGTGMSGNVLALLPLPNGDLIAGGAFTFAGGVASNRVARWNGSAWSPLGNGVSGAGSPQVNALGTVLGSASLLAGGRFTDGLAQWDGATWQPPTGAVGGSNGVVRSVRQLANGDLLRAGDFTQLAGFACNRIARRTAAGWTPLGSGLDGTVHDAIELPNGDIVATGEFGSAGGVACNFIARWNGSTWSNLGSGLSSTGWALTTLTNGDLIAGSSNGGGGQVMRWDGANWTSLLGAGQEVRSVARLANGDLVIGTYAILQPAEVRRWNGAQWTLLMSAANSPNSVQSVLGLLPTANGDLIAVGEFTAANGVPCAGVARFNGSTWSSVGPAAGGLLDSATCVAQLPTGELVVGGRFGTGGRLARWTGSNWVPFGSGLNDLPLAIAVTRDGSLEIGGAFTTANGNAAGYHLNLASGCPASSIPQGSGCNGSGGANTLIAEQAPWLGGTAVSRASGMPANGLAVAVRGLSTLSQPLASILPQGVPGCTLLVSPDLLDLAVPNAGQLALNVPIPSAVALSGAVLHQQVVALELGAGGAITALTSTNALQLTLGNW